MTQTQERTIKALQLTSTYTRGFFNLFELAGNHNRLRRQQVFSELMGVNIPVAKCGITAIETEFYQRLGVTGDCSRHKEKDFQAKAKEVTRDNNIKI